MQAYAPLSRPRLTAVAVLFMNETSLIFQRLLAALWAVPSATPIGHSSGKAQMVYTGRVSVLSRNLVWIRQPVSEIWLMMMTFVW